MRYGEDWLRLKTTKRYRTVELVVTASGRNRQRFERWRLALLRSALLWGALLGVCAPSVNAASSTADPSTVNETSSAAETAKGVAKTVAEVTPAELDVEDTAASGWNRRETLLASLTIFVLAVFVGFEVITKVPPTLHTPLMSGSNAISGITLVGALLAAGARRLAGWSPCSGCLPSSWPR